MKKFLAVFLVAAPIGALASPGSDFQAGTDIVIRNVGGTGSYSAGPFSGSSKLIATPPVHIAKTAGSLNVTIDLKNYFSTLTSSAKVTLNGSLVGNTLTWTPAPNSLSGVSLNVTINGTPYTLTVSGVTGSLKETLSALGQPVADKLVNRGTGFVSAGGSLTINGTVSVFPGTLTLTPSLSGVAGVNVSNFVNSVSVGTGMIYGGGAAATGVVSLKAAAGGTGQTVTLSSGGPISVPSSALVLSGHTSVNVAVNSSHVTAASPAFIDAKVNGFTKTGTVTVLPLLFSLTTTTNPIYAGGTFVLSVNLSAAVTATTVISLHSDDANVTLPPTVTITAGHSSATVIAHTNVAATVPSNVKIEAGYGGTIINATFALY